MAIAPVNKFVSIAVPVAPGLQKLYEVPTGTSALLLYTQVSNVGIAVTYPTVTFVQKRTSRSTGNTRDIRVIKDAEIPPNDAVILIDGRLVLEKTPLVLDQIYVQGTQDGVGIITHVSYDEPSGIATIFTKENHNYNFDYIVSSNDPNIFNLFRDSKKILWMHNTLAIEKALRKKKLLSIIKNKITAVFVSKYLEKKTSNLYFFNKKIIIPNTN